MKKILSIWILAVAILLIQLNGVAYAAENDSIINEQQLEVEEDYSEEVLNGEYQEDENHEGGQALINEEFNAEPENIIEDSENLWAADAINALNRINFFKGLNVEPNKELTLAEFMHLLNNLIRTDVDGDLFSYPNITKSDWFYKDFSHGQALGIFKDVDMSIFAKPNEKCTRENAAIMIARLLGLTDIDLAVLDNYTDVSNVRDESEPYLAALIKTGFFGNGDSLRPNDGITEQELCYLLYSLITNGENLEKVIRYNDNEILKDISQDRLYLCNSTENLTLENLNITSSLIVYAHGRMTIKNCSIANLVIISPSMLELTLEEPILFNTVSVMNGNFVLNSSLDEIKILGGNLTVNDGFVLNKCFVEKSAMQSLVTAFGEITRMECAANGVTAQGNIPTIKVTGRAFVAPSDSSVTDESEAGIDEIQTEIKVVKAPMPSDPSMSINATIKGILNDNQHLCTVRWYLDDELKSVKKHAVIRNGTVLTQNFDNIEYSRHMNNNPECRLEIIYEGDTISFSQKVCLNNYDDAYYVKLEEEQIDTIHVIATVRYNASLYSSMGLGGYICTVPAGTMVTYDNYYGDLSGRVTLPDGTVGWMNLSALDISYENYVRDNDYSDVSKENFVNKNGYSSSTGMLIWVSLKCQKVNVFLGSTGNWKLVQCWPCSSGKNSTPTIGGIFNYHARQDNWDFGYYVVYKPMVFNGGHAFHTRTYIKGSGEFLDATLGSPASHGCIRMPDEGVNWLWDNMHYGTTVVVF